MIDNEFHLSQVGKFLFNTLGAGNITVRLDDFKSAYYVLQEATVKRAIDIACFKKDILVIEIGSWFGAFFGAWIASKNRSSEVHLYNQEILSNFARYLFNDKNPQEIFKFRKEVGFDKRDPENSVNELYRANGLENITCHAHNAYEKDLENIVIDNKKREVLFVSLRTPQHPEDMTRQIANVVGKYPNAHMFITPFLYDPVKDYGGDIVIDIINKHLNIRRQSRNSLFDIECYPKATIYVMMQQYYALKCASIAGAHVYREKNIDRKGFPFHHPTHFVSTLNL